MFYDFAITVPLNTLEDIPLRTELQLVPGVIHHVEVEYRFGPNHMVGLKLLQGGHQLWPTNPDSDFRGNGRAIVFNESYELIAGGTIITAVAYSPGTAYDHQVFVRIGILSKEELSPLTGLGAALKKFLAFFGIKS